MDTKIALKEMLAEIEKSEILAALEESQWVKAKAARRLGLTDRMFEYRLKKYAIQAGKEAGKQTGRAE